MNRLAVAAVALLVPVSAGAFKLLERDPGPGNGPTRWIFVSGTIEYRHNLAGAPAGIDATGLVDEAFDTWTGVPSALIAFSRGADTGLSGFNFGDGENVISYGDAGSDLETGVLAATVIWVPNGTVHGYQSMNFYEITQSDIVFNDGVTFTDSNGASLLGGCIGGKFDIEAVALHEVGHLIGLDHPDDMSYAAAIMFPSIADCDATRTSPKADDVNGATFLYDSGTPPVYPAFNYDENEGYAPFSVSFTDASSGAVTSHSWNFGDGGSSSVADPAHEYTVAGLYDVTLTVNGSAAIERVNAVTVFTRPSVEFSADVVEGDAPLTVTFTNESTDVGADPRYRWQLDGESIFEENPEHEFTEPGTYDVTFSVDAGAGYVPLEKTSFIRVKGEPEEELFPGCSCRVADRSRTPTSSPLAFLLAALGCLFVRRRSRAGD